MLKTLTIATAAILMASPALATCYERTTDVPDIFTVVKGATLVNQSGGPQDGWSGVGGQCTKPGSDRIWVGPRTNDGACLTAASIVGQGPASITQKPDTTNVTVTPDIEEHRVGIKIGPIFIGTGWLPGLCN
jgi:hypothetical protein